MNEEPAVATKTPELLDELNAIGIRELLEHDSRPTFIIDLDPDLVAKDRPASLVPVFCNAALRTYEALIDVVCGYAPVESLNVPANVSYDEFRTWAMSVTEFDDSRDVFPQSFFFGGKLWTGSTLRKRWRFISGNHYYQTSTVASIPISSGHSSAGVSRKAPSPTASGTASRGIGRDASNSGDRTSQNEVSILSSRKGSMLDLATKVSVPSDDQMPKLTNLTSLSASSLSPSSFPSIILGTPAGVCIDWTAPKVIGVMSEHMKFARSIDWGATSLGAMDTWTPQFRQLANLLMNSPHPAAIFWGEELIAMYNEAYKDQIAGRKHPALMGTGFSGPFSEVWTSTSLHDIFQEAASTGKPGSMVDQMLPIDRNGYMEEIYLTWSITPFYGDGTKILGFYNAPFETTQKMISSRRTETLHRLGEECALARHVKDFWHRVLIGLDSNPFDVPFALAYSVTDADDGDSSSHSSNGSSISLKSCVFEGGLGVPEGHAAAAARLDLRRSCEGFIPSFREAMRTREPTKLQTRDGTLPEWLIDDIEWRGFGEPCREAIIFPVRPTTGDNVLGFLLIGVNPRRPYDDEYRSFTNMLNRQLATSLASTILFEEEIRLGATAAEVATLEKERLSEQLALQTNRVQEMFKMSSVAIFSIDSEGLVVEANDRWYDMTGQSREETYKYSLMDLATDESRPLAIEGWHQMSVDGMPWSSEIQLKRPWVDGATGLSIDYWILAAGHPEFNPDGSLRSVHGTLTDISHIKWVQGLQSRRLKEAEEARRQQENFIDMTSHEMRNPLSAILHCADDISSALGEFRSSAEKSASLPPDLVDNCVEAAETIALCAQHQKSIVDDILTVSKLDSDLLHITPSVVQPITIAQRALKMFDTEFQKKDIQIIFTINESLKELDIDWAVCDPSRLLQVLINLVTNAIKFTQSEAIRRIEVRLAASTEPPSHSDESDFKYIPRKNPDEPKLQGPHWGTGDLVYLHFEIEDSGCGLTADEKKLLFLRFSQVSPRTHAQYGGSGLGLFISRQLTELHGGQIGVSSQHGMGSTFAFYIAARRAVSHIGPRDSSSGVDWGPNSPIADLAGQAKVQLSLQDAISGRTAARSTPLDLRQIHVLVVEDNMVNQRVLSKQLQKLGCKIVVASHGGEALEYLETTDRWVQQDGTADEKKREKLTVILMDLEMPVMNGLECVKKIREMEKQGRIRGPLPIIAITANVRPEQVAAAKEAGMVSLQLDN